MKQYSRSAIMSFRGVLRRGIPMVVLICSYIIGIPRCARNDMMAGKMNSHLIQTQPDIACYVNFPHKLEEILI
jgi:hypothetical protein